MFSFLPRSFILFCSVGAVSSLIDIALLYALVEFFHLPLLIAASIALLTASINGYILNKIYTFKDTSKSVAKQYISYLGVSLIGLLLTLLLLKLLVEVFGVYYLHAKLITIVLVTFWNFSINQLFVFKKDVSKTTALE